MRNWQDFPFCIIFKGSKYEINKSDSYFTPISIAQIKKIVNSPPRRAKKPEGAKIPDSYIKSGKSLALAVIMDCNGA